MHPCCNVLFSVLDSSVSTIEIAMWKRYLTEAQERREWGNNYFHEDDFLCAISSYSAGLLDLDRAEERLTDGTHNWGGRDGPLDSIRSFRLILHSNLAESYLMLGMGRKAKEHCDLALTIDNENDAVHERLRHANLLRSYSDELSAKVYEKIDHLNSAKDSGDFASMVDATRELSEISPIGSGKMDTHLKVKIILERAEIEIVLAKALLEDNFSRFRNKVSVASAVSHLDRCGDLCSEAVSLCEPFFIGIGGIGFDVSDTSDGLGASCLATILHAESSFKCGRALMTKEMIRSQISLSTYISTIKSLSDDDRASLYGRLAGTRELLIKGREAVQKFDHGGGFRYDEVPVHLHGRILRCKVEILLKLVVVEWIGLNVENVTECVKSIGTTLGTVTKNVGSNHITKMCKDVSNTCRRLFDGSAEAVHFPIVSTLLSTCIHGYNVVGNLEMEIKMLRALIRARRRCWMSQPLPKYTPRSDEDAEDDKRNILSLVEALKKTGREVDLKCPICMESLLEMEGAVVNPLRCDHMFHNHCCQRYCGSKISTEDMAHALLGHRIIKQLPCPVCRQQRSMRVMRDGSFIEEV